MLTKEQIDATVLAILNPDGMLDFFMSDLDRKLYRAAYVAGMREAANHVERSWRNGYRGDVKRGFAITIRSVADRIEQEGKE